MHMKLPKTFNLTDKYLQKILNKSLEQSFFKNKKIYASMYFKQNMVIVGI